MLWQTRGRSLEADPQAQVGGGDKGGILSSAGAAAAGHVALVKPAAHQLIGGGAGGYIHGAEQQPGVGQTQQETEDPQQLEDVTTWTHLSYPKQGGRNRLPYGVLDPERKLKVVLPKHP